MYLFTRSAVTPSKSSNQSPNGERSFSVYSRISKEPFTRYHLCYPRQPVNAHICQLLHLPAEFDGFQVLAAMGIGSTLALAFGATANHVSASACVASPL